MTMNKFLKLPRWSILMLIVMTMILSVIILASIWFPQWIPEDLFWKILWTYIVLIASSAVIARMTEYLKDMGDDDGKPS
jgi:O-antigen/teichoic acid export membrane protein